MEIALNLLIAFGKMAIFTKLIVPIYEHGRSLEDAPTRNKNTCSTMSTVALFIIAKS